MDMKQVADLRQRFDRGEATTDDLRELSNTYLADNDLENAYPYLCRLAEVETEGCQTSVAAGLVALSLHKEDDAEAHFTRAVNNSPDDYDANHNLGLLNLLRGRLDRARAVFEKLASLHPDQPAIFNDLAIVWARIGKPAEVLKSLEKALELDPEYDQARQQA
ncbi:tetratricopeptide repeat protein, partial [candidate division GN15 bacterium]|nr:tetratricopeptide repeat protein [candidate division GN15 bacterium]